MLSWGSSSSGSSSWSGAGISVSLAIASAPLRRNRVEYGFDIRCRFCVAVLDLGYRYDGQELLEQRGELQFGEQFAEGLEIRGADRHGIDIQLDRDMAVDGGELLADHHGFAIVLQRFAVGLFFDLRSVIEHLLDRAEAPDQLHRTLIADAGGAGDVIDGVSAQGHDIDHPLRCDAQNLHDFRRVADQIFLRRIEHQDPVVHQLQHVLITGHDKHRIGLFGSLERQGADHVIRFIALEFQDGDAVRFEGAADVGQLLRQVGRHLAAIGFVPVVGNLLKSLRLGVETADAGDGFRLLIAKGGSGQVEHRRQVLGRKIVAQFAQHVHEDIDGRRGEPGLGGHATLPRHGVIGAKDERHSVDQKNRVPAARDARGARGVGETASSTGEAFFLAGNG